ncbi:MAG: PD-(D/E)XK nuclease family protein [candidate division WWE3 bacterium]|nr:PD-(D/E)XK nuclease family protein [candidate division WWE3 bacterium]
MLNLSHTRLSTFFTCPRQYFFHYHTNIPSKVDLPRLFGQEVHRHIAQMEKLPREPRRFYYQTKKSAINAWFHRWRRALEREEDRLILAEEEQTKKYGSLGAVCIANYWNGVVDRPRPIQVEETYSHLWKPGAKLVGTIDQLRELPLESIANFRPNLVQDGKLAQGYNPAAIVDLKTNRLSYDPQVFKEDPDLKEWVRLQYDLHEYSQPTIYTWLYLKANGKMPVGFFWFHLRSSKLFFTWRDEQDFETLADQIEHLLGNLEAQSFPKSVGQYCRYCDYIDSCRPRPFLVSYPGELPQSEGEMETLESRVEEREAKQLRLKIKVPREKREKPAVRKSDKQTILVGGEPWDEIEEEKE